MKTTLSNGKIQITINHIGAELTSLKTDDGCEYLWQSNPDYWVRQSPVLFPIVGRFEEFRYWFEDKEYEIEQHGFAKESLFELAEKGVDKLVFRLNSNLETLKKYPFDFEFLVEYRLEENTLVNRFVVKNIGNRTMWFSIGAHPGFRCPLNIGENMTDYYLEFSENETIERGFLEDNVRTDKTELFLQNEKIVPITPELFQRAAIILEGLRSDKVVLKSDKTKRAVTVEFPGFPYLGIWSAPGPYICIEPWYGVIGRRGDIDLKKKEGIQSLTGGRIFECQYRIKVDG